jgi:pyruvate formate lyase activating enzyme
MSDEPDASAWGIPVGFRKTSLVDYPGVVASVVFFPGCNLRCPWCHNRELLLGTAEDLVPLDHCLAEIGRRRRLVSGVAITGGEPLLRGEVGEVIRRVHDMGLRVKLDTNGTLPNRLGALLGDPETRPDYIAVDLKTGSARYRELAAQAAGGCADDCDPFPVVVESLRLAVGARLPFEARSVVCPGFFDEGTATELSALVPDGVPWYFSAFEPGNCLDPAWNDRKPPSAEFLRSLVALARGLGKNAAVR